MVIKGVVYNDVYLALPYEEVAALVSAEALRGLEKKREYGIWWWNTQRTTTRTVRTPGGEYKKKSKRSPRPREEWVCAPVPAYLPRELVEAARARMSQNKRFERKDAARVWELGGVLRCGYCGSSMGTQTVPKKSGGKYAYYVCRKKNRYGFKACPSKAVRADVLESTVRNLVTRLWKDPEAFKAKINLLFGEGDASKKARRNPEKEIATWLRRLEELDKERNRLQDGYLAGAFTADELNARLAGIEEQREAVREELADARNNANRTREQEARRVFYLECAYYVTERIKLWLKDFTDEKARRFKELYRQLGVRVTLMPDGMIAAILPFEKLLAVSSLEGVSRTA